MIAICLTVYHTVFPPVNSDRGDLPTQLTVGSVNSRCTFLSTHEEASPTSPLDNTYF